VHSERSVPVRRAVIAQIHATARCMDFGLSRGVDSPAISSVKRLPYTA